MEEKESSPTPMVISDELMERARMLVGISENLGLPLSGEGGPELNEAVRRAQAERFLSSLDIEALKVGDGSDGLPVWIGIDADARKVYKIYASGLAQGFGDGNLTIINGLQSAEWRVGNGEQLTFGRHVALSGDNVPPTIFESDPHPVAKTPLPNWEAVAKIVKTKPLFILHMPDGQEIRLLASGPEGISGTGIKFESRIWELLRLLPREAYV